MSKETSLEFPRTSDLESLAISDGGQDRGEAVFSLTDAVHDQLPPYENH